MERPTAETRCGKVRGIREDGVDKYLGIPYAKPPVGELRFLPPVECDPWEGVYEADAFGPSPMQPMHPGSPRMPIETEGAYSEDCLYLNVWVPENAKGKKLPVMYWIYGGGYTIGSTASNIYDCSASAKNQEVIIVSVNYRVGIFGFMAHPFLDKRAEHSTNAGIADMIAGLKWVRDNIENFGGDPGNVTLIGVSAGSSAINVLMVCPEANGLYHAAITQSGSPFNHDEWDHDKAEMQKRGIAYLKTIGIETEEEFYSAPARQFLGEDSGQYGIGGYYAVEWSPYVDGDLVPERLEEAFLKGHIHDVPVILGCTADEATVLIGDPKKATKEKFEQTLQRKYPNHKDYIYRQYDKYLENDPGYALARFRSDNTIANMRYFASCLSQNRKEPVYYYIFQRVIPGENAEFYGAFHGGEVYYNLENLHLVPAHTKTDEKVSQSMAKYWSTFAKQHTPNTEGLVEWKPFTPENDMVLYIDEPCECVPLKTKEVTDFLQGLLAERTERNNGGLGLK